MNPLLTFGLNDSPRITSLSVNLNKVALLRNARQLGVPSVLHLATLALQAGAQGITVHPRPDERHIRTCDVHELAQLMQDWPQAEFNIEGNPQHNLMGLLRELGERGLMPQQVTFVPDAVGQATSDHGWQMTSSSWVLLGPLIEEVHQWGARVSLFMDPDPHAMSAVLRLRADRVELYTEWYARAFGTPQSSQVLAQYAATAQAAVAQGLGVNAGHDLNLQNLTSFLQAVPEVQEVSIGHALIADALEMGCAAAVAAYLRCIRDAFQPQHCLP